MEITSGSVWLYTLSLSLCYIWIFAKFSFFLVQVDFRSLQF